ncbi:hypothetical protein ACFL02_08185 [Planctomycetota bacterium]
MNTTGYGEAVQDSRFVGVLEKYDLIDVTAAGRFAAEDGLVFEPVAFIPFGGVMVGVETAVNSKAVDIGFGDRTIDAFCDPDLIDVVLAAAGPGIGVL